MTLQERNYSEKRDFIRMPINAAAVIKLPDEPEERRCVCRDLSAAGMLLEISREVALGTRFKITLPSHSNEFQSLEAHVTVTRCVDYHGNRFLIGVQIDEIG